MPDELSIVLTGGSTGIGAATVSRLAAKGHKITILDIAEPEYEGDFILCDLSDPQSIDSALKDLPGKIDALINVAGVSNAQPNDQIMKVNFLGMRYLTESLIERINDAGSIVIVASTAGFDWRKRQAIISEFLANHDFSSAMNWLKNNEDQWANNAYKFSKQCAAAYTYHAAGLAVHRRVRVNCVNPGSTGTQLTADFRELVGQEMYDWGVAQVGREGTPDDIAEVIDFLATGECRWLNGVELTVDGGYIAGLVSGWVDPNKFRPG